MELLFHPLALTEAIDASVYLESEREGYGDRFDTELDEICERVMRYPKSGVLMGGYPPELDVRCYPMRTFRYTVVVAKINGTLMVQAIAHQHREPGYWA